MSTYNTCFHRETRKIALLFGRKMSVAVNLGFDCFPIIVFIHQGF